MGILAGVMSTRLLAQHSAIRTASRAYEQSIQIVQTIWCQETVNVLVSNGFKWDLWFDTCAHLPRYDSDMAVQQKGASGFNLPCIHFAVKFHSIYVLVRFTNGESSSFHVWPLRVWPQQNSKLEAWEGFGLQTTATWLHGQREIEKREGFSSMSLSLVTTM